MRKLVREAALKISPPLRRLVGERDSIRGRLAELEQEVNVARRRDAAGSSDFSYVFIVTYGRSGSTLLQGLLNSIDGYQIRGENGGALHDLYRAWAVLEDRHQRHSGAHSRENMGWYGIDQFDPSDARNRLRRFFLEAVLQPDHGTQVTGYKEIRWWYKDWQDYFDWIKLTFPGAKFVVNSRNHSDVLKSKWWAEKDYEESAAKLRRYEKRLKQIAEYLGDDAFRVRYDDYVADPSVLQPLFEWLGASWDLASVEAVMEKRHSY